MRRCVFLMTIGVGIVFSMPSLTQAFDAEGLRRLAGRFDGFLIHVDPDGNSPRFVYADAREHIHAYRVENGRYVHDWEITGLGSRVIGLAVGDTDGDNRADIVIATLGGRIIVHDAEDDEVLWENREDPFERIDCMVVENIDRDPQDEVIVAADSYLVVYDLVAKTPEWRSQRKFRPREMVVGNVDDDGQLELILNTGIVLDTRFWNIEFESEGRFGDRIDLIDLNGDEFPEIVGETADCVIRIFDVHAEREIW